MSNTVNNYTETDLGNISLNPRGEYDDSAAYEYLDTVSYQGGSYFCLAELETTITGIAPDAGRNSEHWQMIAAPGDMTPEYTAAYNDVINKAVQVETSRAAVELAQQEIEAVQTDVQQLHSDTVQAAQEAENSKNSAANSAQSAEQSRKTVSESEQNIKGQITGFDSRVSEAVEQSKAEINTTKQQAIDTITNQQNTSVNTVKAEGEKIITRVGNDAKTIADDRATVEEATQTVLNNAREVAQNTQTVAGNMENAAASAESAKTSADNATQSAKSVEDASKQIEQNKKDVASLKSELASEISRATAAEETKADKTSLAQTDRKLDALWKLNQGISYEFQTDDTEAYQKTVPSGAKVANVKSISGKTIVWNQLADTTAFESKTINGIVCTNNEDGSISIKGTSTGNLLAFISNFDILSSHKYYISSKGAVNEGWNSYGIYSPNLSGDSMPSGTESIVVTAKENIKNARLCYNVWNAKTLDVKFYPALIDLTIMFGAGNEPTIEEFEAMFPADYYPYNAGELMSTSVNEITYSDTKTQETSYPIPQAILNLPGYGWSAGDVYNEVDWENKKYIQRVTKVDLGTLPITKYSNNIFFASLILKCKFVDAWNKINAICSGFKITYANDSNNDDNSISATEDKKIKINSTTAYPDISTFKQALQGVTLYYELAEPIITDISDIIPEGFLEAIEVETGGSLTFKNSHGDDYRIPVPSSEEYVISLAEVAK